jgi:dTDP-4-dehydrorhamnose 3,5-epimerase
MLAGKKISMEIIDTSITEVKILRPKSYGDDRGFFMETFKQEWFAKNVSDVTFLQENHSKSSFGILRGLHFQTSKTQGKLVRVISGEVFDVAVDVRSNSPTFGKWVGLLLSEENRLQLWVPEGFAHGFLVTSANAEFVYKCTNYYEPKSEISIKWDDAHIAINWPVIQGGPQLSEKDKLGLSWSEVPYFTN